MNSYESDQARSSPGETTPAVPVSVLSVLAHVSRDNCNRTISLWHEQWSCARSCRTSHCRRADIQIVNDATGVRYSGLTNGEGIYAISTLPPGPYRLQVSKTGFKTLIKPDIILNVQDALAINFTLPIGALSETVTVEGGAALVNTESAAVSTVVDRHFAEKLPMNGRSFQTLIQLTPGVVLTTYDNHDNGQFSVNGQRTAANYWMVDGVGANVGIGTHLFCRWQRRVGSCQNNQPRVHSCGGALHAADVAPCVALPPGLHIRPNW